MSKYFKKFLILIAISIINLGTFNLVWADEISNELDHIVKVEARKVLEDLVTALEKVDYSSYLDLFHKKSPIYFMHYPELRDALKILSSYELSYEIESIRFIEKKNKDIKVEVDLLAQSHDRNDYYDRKNTFDLILRENDKGELKIYDMEIKNIEFLNEKDKVNSILGKKRLYYDDGSLAFEGYLKDGLPDGEGIRYYNNGKIMYEGTFTEGEMTGVGILYDEIGYMVYEGEVKNGLPDGEGTAFYLSGKVFYKGYWKNGLFDRRGKLQYENGLTMYMGEFSEGKANGKGRGYYNNGTLWYEGEMKDNYSHGQGIEYYETGEVMYEGEFAYGVPHGKGKKYDKEGKVIYSGYWENGSMVRE